MECVRTEKALNLPNFLTAVRIGLLPVMVWRFTSGDMRGALTLYLLSMLTDAADGFLARRLGQITSIGKLLDPLADKLSLLTVMWLFAAQGQIARWAVALILLKEALLILGSVFALQKGIVVCAHSIGKATTAVFVLSMTLRFLGFAREADWSLGAAVALSYAALVRYAQALLSRKCITVSTK